VLTGIIDGELKRESTEFWLKKLNGVLPVAPVLDLAQALDSPFLQTTEMIHTISHPAKPAMRVLSNPIKIDGERLAQTPCSPYGADNAAYVGEMRATERAGSS
jgi:crotonobetainyl-CoA:carnitine CoA-transferase CaiB-like acyl-CoA transferase